MLSFMLIPLDRSRHGKRCQVRGMPSSAWVLPGHEPCVEKACLERVGCGFW